MVHERAQNYEYVHVYEYDLQTMNISPNPQVIRASGQYKMEVLAGIRRSRIFLLISGNINFWTA